MRHQLLQLILCLLLVSPVVASNAQVVAPDTPGQIVNDGLLKTVTRTFLSSAQKWQEALARAASYLFWTLGLISIVWTGVTIALRKGDFGDFLSEFLKFSVFFGFFLWLLTNGPKFAFDILISLQNLGRMASQMPRDVSPDVIVILAYNLFIKTISGFSATSPILSLFSGLMALGVVFFLVRVALNFLLLTVSGYLVLYAGIFVLGFGGSRWTSDIAINYYKTVLSIGIQLLTCILLVSIGADMLDSYSTRLIDSSVSYSDLCVMLIFALVLWELTTKIPPMVAGMINGATGGQQLAASNVAAVAATAATLATGGVAAAKQTAGAGSAVIAAAKAAMASDASSGFGALSRMRESDDVAKSAPSRSGSSGSAGSTSRQSSAADAAGKAIPDSVRSAFADRRSQSGAGQSSGSPVSSGSSDSGSSAAADRSASNGSESPASQSSSQGSDSSSSGSSSNGAGQAAANAAFTSQDSPPSASSANSSMDSNPSASGSANPQESSEGSRSTLEQSASAESPGSAKPWEVSDGQVPQQDISQMSGTASPSESASRDSSRPAPNKDGSEAPEKPSVASRVGRVAKGTISNLAGAAMSSIKEDLAKNTVGGRLAERITRKQREAENAEKNRNYIASAGPEFRAQVEELVNSTRKQEG